MNHYARSLVANMRRRATPSMTSRVVAAGWFVHCGLPAEASFGPSACEEAEATFGPSGCDLLEAMRFVCEVEGTPSGGNNYDLIQAASSTATGDAIFSTAIGAAIQMPFNASMDTTVGWVREREVPNFSQQERPRVDPVDGLPRVARGTSATDTPLAIPSAETYTPFRFGRKFSAGEQDLVDDGVNGILDQARMLGQAALSEKLNRVYAVLLANAALADGVALFDASTHANLDTTSSLAASTLDAAMSGMRRQTANSVIVGVEPKILLVPTELEGLAKRLCRDMDRGDDTDLIVRAEPRLSAGVTVDDTTYTGSATTWYVASENWSSLEFGYIDQPTPTVRPFGLKGGRWGLGWDIKYDFGIGVLGHQGIHKSTA